MTCKLLIAAAATALASTGALADDYSAKLTGSGTFQYVDPRDAIGVPGGCDPSANPNSSACLFGLVDIQWAGKLQVATDGGDGVYTVDTGLTDIVFTSNWGDFNYTGGAQAEYLSPLGAFPVGLAPGATVTISGGRLASINLSFRDATETFEMAGLSARAYTSDGGENSNNFQVFGALDPVPEPRDALLLAAGLAVLVTARRFNT